MRCRRAFLLTSTKKSSGPASNVLDPRLHIRVHRGASPEGPGVPTKGGGGGAKHIYMLPAG